jgi:CBS domain-containing protein
MGREATMTVRAILDTKGLQVVSIGADATVSSVVTLLTERRIGAVLVMAGDKMEGIVSERDIVRALSERGAAVLDESVRILMTSKVMTCRRADTVSSVMEKMTEGKFRHLPVIEDGRVVGIVSIGDVVKHRLSEFEREQEALRDYIKTA